MDIRLPYSKRKRYLTGVDWSVNTLDSLSKQATGHGNSSQIVFSLGGALDPETLRATLRGLFEAHPVLTGRVGRDWNLCPYWRMGRPRAQAVPLSVESGGDEPLERILPRFHRHVNAPFASQRDHLHFHLVQQGPHRSWLGMHFDHRLLDAFGAEVFMELVHRAWSGLENPYAARDPLTKQAHLDQWARRFVAGRNVNRRLLNLTRGGVANFPIPPVRAPRDTRFEHIFFEPGESARILNAAERESGFLMVLPSLLARALRAVHRLAARRGRAVDHYVVPVSVVRRNPDAVWEDLFFNQMSFVIFQVPVRLAETGDELVACLRDQLYEQVKSGLPEDFYHASMLTRIAPLALMRLVAKLPAAGKVGTIVFACLKESGYSLPEFMGLPVDNLFHTPHVPPPPGVGIFLNQFRGRLNLVLSHLDGILPGDDAAQLTSDVRESLLA